VKLIHSKFAKKSKYQWTGRIHQVLTGGGTSVYTDHMTLQHHQKPRPYRSDFLQKMEWCVIKDNDTRTKYYLGREYFYHARYQDAINMFQHYLQTAIFRPEIADAWLLMAKCAWQIQQGDNARKWCLQAIGVNPDFAEALRDMAVYTGEGQSEHWTRHADHATNKNVLFVHS
jgi:tetratricopeptide (TPR) repeat protein